MVTEAGILKDVAGSSAQSCKLGRLLPLPVSVLNSSKHMCDPWTCVCGPQGLDSAEPTFLPLI